jgi:hypothetical protein
LDREIKDAKVGMRRTWRILTERNIYLEDWRGWKGNIKIEL